MLRVNQTTRSSGHCWFTVKGVKEGGLELTRAGYHVVFFLSPVATPSTQTTLPNMSSFGR